MDKALWEKECDASLDCLRGGGIILYPTDTVWGIGCDATNEEAVKKIYNLKKRSDQKSMLVLVATEKDIFKYVAAVDLALFSFLEEQTKPTTTIYDGAINLAPNLVNSDGSIAIRIVQDDFCRHLVKRLQKPIVSTSANLSGDPSPQNFFAISKDIKKGVDYIVGLRQNETAIQAPSQIIRWEKDGSVTYIRR